MTSGIRRVFVCAAVCLRALALGTLPVHAQTTALSIDSEPGDYIGQGLQRTWTDTDLIFSAAISTERSRITITARTENYSTWWNLDFAAPAGMPLTPAVYENAGRSTFSPMVSPGLIISGSGRGCSRSVGRFVVYEVEVSSGGAVTAFAADFEQHCEGSTPALFGAIRFNAARSSLLPFDGAYPVYSLHMDAAVNGYVTGPGIDCGAGRTDCDETYGVNASITLQAVPSPGYVFLGWAGLDCVGERTVAVTISRRKFCTPVFNVESGGVGGESPDYSQGALFLDGMLGTGEIPVGGHRIQQAYLELPPGTPTASAVTVTSATTSQVQLRVIGPRAARWDVTFAAAPGALLAPGTYEYTAADAYSRGPAPLLSVSGSGGTCSGGGRFEIYEVAFFNGALTAFAADFEAPCGASAALTSGSIRYRATRASLLPFNGAYPLNALRIIPAIGGYVISNGIDCGDGGRTDCDETYVASTTVSLEAFASPGYQFVGWSGSCTDDSPLTTLTVNRVKRCFAVFTPTAASAAPADPSLAAATLLIDAPGSTDLYSPARSIWLGADALVSVYTQNEGASASFTFTSPVSGSASVNFYVPGGRIAPGDYEEAYPYPLPSFPGFGVSTCSITIARFRVYEASFDGAGRLLAFAADFESFCSSASRPYVVGAVRFNSTRARLLPFDGAYPVFKLTIEPAINGTVTGMGIDCGPGHTDCSEVYGTWTSVMLVASPAPGYRFVGWTGACFGGATTSVAVNWIRRCSAVFNGLVPGVGPEDPRTRTAALFIDSQNGDPVGEGRRHVWLDAAVSVSSFDRSSARLNVRIPDGNTWTIDMRAPGVQELGPGAYNNAVYPYGSNRTGPALYVTSPRGSCSSNLTGRFVIYEIAFASATSSTITSLAADFEQRCTPGGPALLGSIRYNSTRSELTPFVQPPTTHAPFDINGDGRPDFVWQNRANGRLAAWFMNGTVQIDNASLIPEQVTDPSWHIVGSGDGNRDGQMDLYWQHQTTGALAIWFMIDTNQLRSESLSPSTVADTAWKVRTVTDLDQDGHPDLIWQHTGSGQVAVWFMAGSRLRSGELLVPGQVSDLNWKIVASGDVDRDGHPDLFWHHAVTGQVAVWFMRGRTASSGQAISPDRVSDTAWQVRGAVDLDGNGSPDLIWQNTATLQVAAWLMNGLRLIDGRLIAGPTLPSADWYLVSPK